MLTDQGAFHGTHAIVTLPLGVLKAKHIVFKPALPATKLNVIEALGVGHLEKLIFQFDEPLWRSNVTKKQNLFYIAPRLGEFPAFFDVGDIAGCPMLAILLAGDQSRQLTDDPASIIQQANEILAKIYPKSYRPPTASYTTNWRLDPFSLGTYSIELILLPV